jgi:hypothetical protein
MCQNYPFEMLITTNGPVMFKLVQSFQKMLSYPSPTITMGKLGYLWTDKFPEK